MSWIKGKKYPQMVRKNGHKNLGKYSEKGYCESRDLTGLRSHEKGEFNQTEEAKEKISKANKGKLHGGKGKPRINNRGENHYNWKGGKSREYDRVRNCIEWVNWRKAVFERDAYTCQVCGKTQCELHPHHKVQVKDLIGKNEDMIYKIDNGITLCKDCHKKVHRKRI